MPGEISELSLPVASRYAMETTIILRPTTTVVVNHGGSSTPLACWLQGLPKYPRVLPDRAFQHL
eukprot:4826059-Pleurochrysis_carterae.AAC.8